MFRFKTIINKPVIASRDSGDVQNTAQLDLTSSVFSFEQEVQIDGIYYITDESAMRPDILTALAYGDDEDTDLILTFNKVSNPFAIEKGDVFVVPERASLDASIRRRNQLSSNNLADLIKRANESKLDRESENRQRFLKRKEEERKDDRTTRNGLPPNFVDDGTSGIEPRDGRIVLGNNVSEVDCVTGGTEAQVKSSVIRNRIVNKFKERLNSGLVDG
jgi:hypothetical protein